MGMEYRLPWPPSVNHYWHQRGARRFLSARAKEYKQAVAAVVSETGREAIGAKDRLAVSIVLRPPDRRRRDIDNTAKAILDALAGAGVYEDDCQIDQLTIERDRITEDGIAIVSISKIS
jgi:crossover junction endodeoxyribonuclease RusA